jgi:ribosomal protein S18 acetylase RimI-like enzyme
MPSIKLLSVSADAEWIDAGELVQELIDWDIGQSENLGFARADVIRTFYPDGLDDIRRSSAAPAGCFLIAIDQGDLAGCASYRFLKAETCELYNVYVRANYRGRGIGAVLVQALQRTAVAAGYRAMYLETASFMKDAHRLYRSLQFEVVEPYRSIPAQFAPVTIAMRCALAAEIT